MDFILKIPDDVKNELTKLNIDDISLYLYSDVDINLKYNKIHYVISKDTLYVFDAAFKMLFNYKKDDIEGFKIDYILNYGKLFIKLKNNEKHLIACFDKGQSKHFSLFEKYALKALNNQLTDQDYKEKDNALANDENKNKKYKKVATLFRLLKYLKKYKLAFVSIITLLIVSSLVGVVTPILTGQILYNEILDNNGKWYGQILLFASMFLLLKIFGVLLNVIYGRTMAKMSARICYDMKSDVFTSMQKLSLNFFKDKETGNLMNRVVWDVNMVFYYIVDDIPNLCVNFMQIIGIIIYLIILNFKLALIVFIPMPIVVLIFMKISPIFKRNWHQNASRNNELNNIVSDTLQGFRVVKVFSGHNKEIKRFENISIRNKNTFIRNAQFMQISYPLILLFISITAIAVWGIGGYLVIIGPENGGMRYGDFSTFIAGLDLLFYPLEYLVNIVFSSTPRVLTCASRIFEIADATPEIKEIENPISIEKVNGDIEFKNVSFSYEINQPILKDISFKVKANTSLGIVGQTGAGKSTLMNLLARLYDVNEGCITIDGINIKDLSFKTLHSNVSMISQDTYLFKGSIMDNIRYAKLEATFEEVINAAKVANAHDFIMKFENGYDTIIGQGATNLSGGERQRISIARAVLLNSKIIIFDEATSAMDTITEKAIQESITRLSENKTVLMIAHRLSTLKDVDRLIVIDNKGIVEEGTMQELVELNGKFNELYTIQQEALKQIRIGD